jgi:hypothetical protein
MPPGVMLYGVIPPPAMLIAPGVMPGRPPPGVARPYGVCRMTEREPGVFGVPGMGSRKCSCEGICSFV